METGLVLKRGAAGVLKRVWRRGRNGGDMAPGGSSVQVVATANRVAVGAVKDFPTMGDCVKEDEVAQPPQRHDSVAEARTTFHPSITTEEVFATFVHDIESGLTVQQQQAREFIQRAYALSQPDNIEQLITEMVEAMDVFLFRGELAGETGGHRPATTAEDFNISITLSESLIPLTAKKPDLAWGTLLHEMLHAYEIVLSGQEEECLCGNKVYYGPAFLAAVTAAVKVLEIESITVESVAEYEEGCCHSKHDEYLLWKRREKEACVLADEVRDWVLGWWKGSK